MKHLEYHAHAYDNRNRMISAVEKSSGGTTLNQATYTYDAENRRIGIDDNGTQTWVVFDGTSPFANPYADFNGSGALLTRYMSTQAVDEILARTSSCGNTAWYLTDRLGSVRDVVSVSGTVLDHVIYDSYGNITSETNATNGDRFKFTGMEWDAAIGQYYDHARWYGAGVGRFEQQDPMGFGGGDTNLYRYVGADPTNFVDVTGLQGSAGGTQGTQQIPPYYQPTQGESRGYMSYVNTYSIMIDEGDAVQKKVAAAMISFYEKQRIHVDRNNKVLKEETAAAYANNTLYLKVHFLNEKVNEQKYARALTLAHEAWHKIYEQQNKPIHRSQEEEYAAYKFQLSLYKRIQDQTGYKNSVLEGLAQMTDKELQEYIANKYHDYPKYHDR